MTDLLAGWVTDPMELKILLALTSLGILVAFTVAVARREERMIGLPRGLGVLALLLGTFGYVLGIDVALLGRRLEFLEATLLFQWGGAACAGGFLGTWFLEWHLRRDG